MYVMKPWWLQTQYVDCLGPASIRDMSLTLILLVVHRDNRAGHIANHNLLPDMHLCVLVLHASISLVLYVREVIAIF